MSENERTIRVIRPTKDIEGDNGIKRFAAYCRVSTDSDDQVNSFLTQVRYYTDMARENENFELVDIYADEGITGTCVSKRDEFKRLMRDCSLGKIDVVYVKSVQRFARNSLECLEAVRKMKDYGVTVFFENDKINTMNMNSEMILYLKSAFAQNEALTYSKRLSTSYRMKMEDGSFITYHAPYGYRLVEQQLVVEPNEAETIKRIFSMYLSGMGVNKITSTLRENAPNEWNTVKVRYILSNEKYIGDSMLQKTYTPPVFPLHSKTNNGQMDKFYVENTHQAIISKEDFQAVQQRLIENKGERDTSRKKYRFSNLIYCDECGSAYRRKEQNGIVYWVCSKNGLGGYKCAGQNIREDEVENAFICMYNRFRQFQIEILDNTVSMLEEARNKIISQKKAITEIDADIAKLSGQNEMYHKLRAKNIMDDVSFNERIGDLQNRLTVLRSRRLKLLGEDENTKCIEQLHQIQDVIDEYPKAILTFQKDIFEMLVERICVDREGNVIFVVKGGIRLKEKVKAHE